MNIKSSWQVSDKQSIIEKNYKDIAAGSMYAHYFHQKELSKDCTSIKQPKSTLAFFFFLSALCIFLLKRYCLLPGE